MRGTMNQLKGEGNYSVCKIRITGILISNNLWDLVNEEREIPPKREKHEDEAVVTDEEQAAWNVVCTSTTSMWMTKAGQPQFRLIRSLTNRSTSSKLSLQILSRSSQH